MVHFMLDLCDLDFLSLEFEMVLQGIHATSKVYRKAFCNRPLVNTSAWTDTVTCRPVTLRWPFYTCYREKKH